MFIYVELWNNVPNNNAWILIEVGVLNKLTCIQGFSGEPSSEGSIITTQKQEMKKEAHKMQMMALLMYWSL